METNNPTILDYKQFDGYSKEQLQKMLYDQCKLNLVLENRIDEAIEYLDNYDVFEEFSFPLMKRWEEQQVKSSINYYFHTTLDKNLKDILRGEDMQYSSEDMNNKLNEHIKENSVEEKDNILKYYGGEDNE